MEEQPTCGQGLATHALVPQLFAAYLNATADNLINHIPMLVASDADTQHERSVYEDLFTSHREVAAMLEAIATEMKDHHDMRMGQHDVAGMSHENVTKALESMVRAEAQLVAQLELQLAEHRAMVDEMRS